MNEQSLKMSCLGGELEKGKSEIIGKSLFSNATDGTSDNKAAFGANFFHSLNKSQKVELLKHFG